MFQVNILLLLLLKDLIYSNIQILYSPIHKNPQRRQSDIYTSHPKIFT